MNKVMNFDETISSGLSYGGHGGSKKGILLENEAWFLKYPKSTKSMEITNMSYSTTPLSEYLGSHIYELLNIEVHKTKLGVSNGKLVVACKDFLSEEEALLDYNSIKNEYDENVEQAIINLSSNSSFSSDNNLEELYVIMEKNPYFQKIKELTKRFWDMYVVDAWISNNDRNEGNWGLILNKRTKEIRIAPVYDNGASFYNKSSNQKIENILLDEVKFYQVAYESSISIFQEEGKKINPLKYMESRKNGDCNAAILRIVPKIDLKKIKELIDELPEEFLGVPIISRVQKEFYYKILEYRYEKVLKPIYEKLKM